MISAQIDEEIATFRRFNRFYTRTIGTLSEGLLDSLYSLTEARILYELAHHEQATAKEIAGELKLDAGYLSRILRKFEDAELIEKQTSTADARLTILKLTQRGRASFGELNQLSNKQARELLDCLPPSKRDDLLRSMRAIEDVLTHKTSVPYILRQHRPGDMGWVTSRHGASYAQEYGWDEHFEALVARIVADFIIDYDPKRERCWIAERNGDRLGCIFLVKHSEQSDTARLRLLLVEPSARGLGLGKALVNECVSFARTAGYRKVTLWTQSILTAAHHIYQKAGFKLIREEPHHSFGADLIGQTWELTL
ncbi:helix-turn-helix domain-containing GNAT family N-acetyltransferase [Alloacidobacterium sp.]|uniref:bifunctional helix-turn-helix transcriptional regulator/GNAT family N-acetyltransferase n=1 Tax=Alloacidobacterium sp. TaxID=2951999 RepID=UPI002D5409AA|nr:helix-turn-helix domain-containing GNAT family N-acetyltransferase [Alloacidobacterium sp.]HYK38246.1 helix-turn-helix domain-containing GNAT family N-acetyltransferase [Alloacidobacterium sp.]